MAKYIDRDALIEWIKRIPIIDLSDGCGLCKVIFEDDFRKAIKEMPKTIIADVSPVRHGRWLYGDYYDIGMYVLSVFGTARWCSLLIAIAPTVARRWMR